MHLVVLTRGCKKGFILGHQRLPTILQGFLRLKPHADVNDSTNLFVVYQSMTTLYSFTTEQRMHDNIFTELQIMFLVKYISCSCTCLHCYIYSVCETS